MSDHKAFYKRNLPHYQPQAATYSITYRLYGSIPLSKISQWKEECKLLKTGTQSPYEKASTFLPKYFLKYEGFPDKLMNGPYWLQQPEIAEVVAESLLFNDKKQYDLWCFNIMPNHVHAVLTLLEHSLPLYSVLQRHKRFTARQCNKLLNRTGSFWEQETYDHVIRNHNDFLGAISYTLNNAVKAGFVKNWSDWRWAYIHPDLAADFK